MKITGGNIPSLLLLSSSPGFISDESKTPKYSNTLICNAEWLATLAIGAPPPAGEGAHTIEISDATPIGGGFYQVNVVAIDPPQDVTFRELAQVTILPRVGFSLRPEAAMRLRSTLRPRTVLLNCEREVKFVESAHAANVSIPDPAVPTFEGVPVDFYGGVYDNEGERIGTTHPFIPPQEILVSVRLEPWLGTYYKLTTVKARRPAFI